MKYELDSIDESVVTLDTYNSDLNLVIDASKYSAQPLTKEGFAFMWAGARATHGVIKGRICFEVKVIEHLDVSYLPSDEPNPHVVRVGFSVNSSSLQLGEDPLSYGYGGTGKISTNCQFKDFGPSFVAGDCILAVADLDTDFIQIGFAKNGNFIGWAYKVKKTELEGKALFPHVLTKNCSFEVNFGQRDEPYFKLTDSVKDYTFVGCLPMDERVGGARPPEKREDCEMIMMCGLPGAGKSVWAAEYSQNNPDKKYNVLGTNNIIDKMKVMGLPRKRNYSGRWDVLIQMATKCLNSMFAIGSKLRRNYILDQTNVYPTAQRRKMRNFDGFKRIAVVVVPTEEEYKRRCDKRDREEGKEIPDSAVLEMKANFKLPEVNDVFEEVIFTELQREEAEKLVKLYNEEGKAALGPARKQFRPNEPMKDSKGFDNRKGNFGFNKGDNRGFPGEQGIRGPNTYGISRGDYGRGGFNNRGGFNGGRGGRGGYESGFGGRDNYNMRGGYDNSGNYGDFDNRGGRDGYDTNYSGPRGGFEDHRSGGRSGFEDNYGGYDSSRGGRGGYDGGRGGSRGGYDSGRGGGRGGYDSGRGGSRGGYEGSRGGGRGGYDGNSGGSRGGYDGSSGGSRGGYDGSSGGSRGGYDGSRGSGRGGYDGGRGGGRGGYDSGRRGGYEGSRASGRGGSDSSRGSGRSDFDRRDSYNNKRDSYSSYETANKDSSGGNYGAGYGSDRGFDKGSRFEQSGDSFRGDYSASENIPGGTRRGSYGFNDYGGENYSAERFSDKGYGNDSSTEYKRGTSNSRFQSSNRGAASRSGFPGDVYSRDDYSTNYNPGNTASTEGSYSRDYGYSSSYGDYKAQSTTDSYAARDTPSLYSSGPVAKNNDSSQRFTGSNMDTGSKYTQGTRTRWSSDTPQTASSVDTYSAGRSQSYNYPKSDQSAVSYQDKQTYGYQQGMTANTTTQQWMTSSAPSASSPAGYGSAQAQWMQYGQQLPNQYYSQ